jgi:uncharacterized membrane protein
VIITAVLAAFVWLAGKWTNPAELPARTWVFLTLSALATGASWVCYFRALQIGEASQVAPIDKASLVLVAAFAFVFLGERPTTREWLAIALVASGVMLLALSGEARMAVCLLASIGLDGDDVVYLGPDGAQWRLPLRPPADRRVCGPRRC